MRVLLIILLIGIIYFPAQAVEDDPSAYTNLELGHPACAGVTRQTPSTPECDGFIASRPFPTFARVPVDFGAWPGKDQLGDYPRVSYFSGVTLPGGLDMPFAWVLWGVNAKDAPAGRYVREGGHYDRYQLVNIFATVNISGWDWHLVGPGHWIMQKNLSIVYPQLPSDVTPEGRWVSVNLYEQNLVVYDGGAPIMATLVASGIKNGKWNTRVGTFRIGVRLENSTMSGAEGQPDFYSLSDVPYSQYFDGLISLHGTYWHDGFGFTASHGCVNLSISDAKWLYEHLGEGTMVHVYERKVP